MTGSSRTHRRRWVFPGCLGIVSLAAAAGWWNSYAVQARLDAELDALSHALEIRRAEARAQFEPPPQPIRVAAAPKAEETSAWAEELRLLEAELIALRKAKRPAAPIVAKPIADSPWHDSGRATPLSTFQSVQWAINAGEVNALEKLIVLGPDARRVAQDFFDALDPDSQAEFGDAQHLVASVMAAKSRSGLKSAEMISGTIEPDGATAARLRLTAARAGPREITLRFQPSPEGWKLDVPEKIVTSYRNLLLGPVVDPATYNVVR